MMNLKTVSVAMAVFSQALGCSSPQTPNLHEILARPPVVERSAATTTVPLYIRLNKLFLPATVNGRAREFIFDTGSPTILTREFADTLGLEIVGQNTGRDANGQEVTMDVAVVDSLSLGDVVFRHVPVLIHDFSRIDLAPCIFDGGVIGSEILPGSVWRIDTEAARLEISTSPAALPAVLAAPLHDVGYPHAPLVDYSLGDVRDTALFDTGNSGHLVLFDRLAEREAVQARILTGSATHGQGSDGVSAGGHGAIRDLTRFTLSRVSLGDQTIGPIRAMTRPNAPTLIGAGLLGRYSVTLDYQAGQFLLQNRRHPAPDKTEADYSVSVVDGHATVTQLIDGSPAAKAGLKLGDRVIRINGRSMAKPGDTQFCEAAFWLSGAFERTKAAEITVERNGSFIAINVPPPSSSE